MKNQIIIIAGATGQLGSRIAGNLFAKGGVRLRVLVRRGTARAKLGHLQGAEVCEVEFANKTELSKACEGGSCVISALAGLRDVIVETQSGLLEAAVAAGVPRFIPSDFSIDYTKIPEGWNRNLNLRSELQEKIEKTKIQTTSILNGAFTDMLTGQAPFLIPQINRVLCWGDPHQKMDWTTMDNTASYTAEAALDDSAPRFLRIAGDEVSASDLARIATEVTGKQFKVLRPGGPQAFKALISVV
ncbi:MAG: NmrA family NAD(P)-binding protein, partial [Bdellovibrionales bacterium]|nr:NmrA family NAD(P)-binding protein [Bdellovibrionales bacterium]